VPVLASPRGDAWMVELPGKQVGMGFHYNGGHGDGGGAQGEIGCTVRARERPRAFYKRHSRVLKQSARRGGRWTRVGARDDDRRTAQAGAGAAWHEQATHAGRDL
jgi:hypothetical protein